MNDISIEYEPDAKGKFGLLKNMYVEKGDINDWHALHALHYKAESLPAGARYWRCKTEEGDLVGIVVMSSVSLLLAPRHTVLPKLKPGNDTHFSNVARGHWLNANMRRAARIVTDTMYRGVGVSYRMVNLAMRMEGFKFIEIQSSMSKFNPFDLKAGFKHAHLKPAAAYDKGMAFFRSYLSCHPADFQAVMNEYSSWKPGVQSQVLKDFQEFYYKNSAKEKTGSNLNAGTNKVAKMTFSEVLKELQQLVFATPVYGIWKNPDLGIEFPERMPLLAYDNQEPIAPINLDKL